MPDYFDFETPRIAAGASGPGFARGLCFHCADRPLSLLYAPVTAAVLFIYASVAGYDSIALNAAYVKANENIHDGFTTDCFFD